MKCKIVSRSVTMETTLRKVSNKENIYLIEVEISKRIVGNGIF